jgi:hypothetical protein
LDEMIWAHEQIVHEDWESRYHHGNIEFAFEKIEYSKNKRLGRGPNDTHWFDVEGYKNHQKKIENGLRLFGKYYQALWD